MFANAPFRWTDPATWPWIMYVWLALPAGGWLLSSWRWLQRRRAAVWPIANGRIESTEVTKPTFSFTTKRGYYVAQLGYSYSVAGSIHSGLYKRDFPTELAAEDFWREMSWRRFVVDRRARTSVFGHAPRSSYPYQVLLSDDMDAYRTTEYA